MGLNALNDFYSFIKSRVRKASVSKSNGKTINIFQKIPYILEFSAKLGWLPYCVSLWGSKPQYLAWQVGHLPPHLTCVMFTFVTNGCFSGQWGSLPNFAGNLYRKKHRLKVLELELEIISDIHWNVFYHI